MMEHFRQGIQKFFIWVIVILICGSFALWGVHNYISSNNINPTVAKVNGAVITKKDLKTVYDRMTRDEQFNSKQNISNTPQADEKRKQQALEELIDAHLLLFGALKDGFRVSTAQTNDALWNISIFQDQGKFSQDKFKNYLRNTQYSLTTFLEELNTKLLLTQVQNAYTISAFVLPNEIESTLRLANQSRDIVYVVIPANSVANTIKVSPEEIAKFYQEHQDNFKNPEQISINYITLSVADLSKHVQPTDQEILDYYQSNLDSFKQPGEWNISHILVKIPKNATAEEIAKAQDKINALAAELKQGKDFAQLAKEKSEDIVTAKHNGEIGWVTSKTFHTEFEAAINSLKHKGDISPPIKTPYGFSIIKLNDIKPEVVPNVAQVKDQVRKSLIEQKAHQQFIEMGDQLSDLTYSQSDSLQPAADALHLPIQTTGFFTAQGGPDALTNNPKVISAAFSPEVLQQKYNSSVIQLDDTTAMVLRVKEFQPATQRSLQNVTTDIQKLLTLQKTLAATQEKGSKIVTELNAGTAREKIAEENQFHWLELPHLTRADKTTDIQILSHTFNLAKPSNKKYPAVGFQRPNGDYVIIVLTRVADTTTTKTAAEQRQLQLFLEQQLGYLDYDFYIVSLKQRANITIESDIALGN